MQEPLEALLIIVEHWIKKPGIEEKQPSKIWIKPQHKKKCSILFHSILFHYLGLGVLFVGGGKW